MLIFLHAIPCYKVSTCNAFPLHDVKYVLLEFD